VKRYLVTETENYHGQVISMTKQELPPNARVLTREQVSAALTEMLMFFVVHEYGDSDLRPAEIELREKKLNELFGGSL